MNLDLPTLLTTSEVAKYLRVTNTTVLNMIHDGRIIAIKLPGSLDRNNYRIPMEQLEKLFETHTT